MLPVSVLYSLFSSDEKLDLREGYRGIEWEKNAVHIDFRTL